MAVKASANITLTSVVDIQATYRYYLLQSSTLAKPSKPTANPPGGNWDDVEPTYTSGSTNSLYYVDLTVFSNGTFSYSDVSLSTAYEAAKEAYNKAVAAQGTADNAAMDADNAGAAAANAQSSADSNAERITNALMAIDSVNAIIQTLITGENGESLMTQTDTGWTFSMTSIQNTLASLGANVGTLNADSAEAKSLIDSLNQSVADLGEYTDYIKFGVIDSKPCIYLGETDSPFKVLITNTDIRFMEGSVIPASISNQALNIETAVVNKEIRQGGFSWNVRANGNYSLSWKG